MTTLSIVALIIISAFAIGFYNHYTADSFAFNICLRDNLKRVLKVCIEAVKAANVKRMIRLEKSMRKAGKGTGAHYMLSAEWKALRSYNIALGSI